ncbi:MAG: aspartyl protease family protein [Gemmataceae bacterium]
MSQAFNAQQGLILIPAELEGPSGTVLLRLALDTGATDTLIGTMPLVRAGYDLSLAQTYVQAKTASGVVLMPRLPVLRLKALGQERTSFAVLAHSLPSASFDGLLGLDFLRGQFLTVDFRQGQILLS